MPTGIGTKRKKLRVVRRLRDLIKKYVSHGISLALYKEHFDDVVTGEFRDVVGKYHYTIAVRSLLGDVSKWRTTRPFHDPFEYVLDWMEPHDLRRKEVENVLSTAHLAYDAMEKFGGYEGFYSFRNRRQVVPLQAADLLSWATFQAAKLEYQKIDMHPIADETIRDFIKHDHEYHWFNRRIWHKDRLRNWVRDVTENGTLARMKAFYESHGVTYLNRS
jgi:hypothetical protein